MVLVASSTGKRVTNMDVNVCGKRALLQQHSVMKGDVLWRVIPRDGAGPLACRPRVEIETSSYSPASEMLAQPAD